MVAMLSLPCGACREDGLKDLRPHVLLGDGTKGRRGVAVICRATEKSAEHFVQTLKRRNVVCIGPPRCGSTAFHLFYFYEKQPAYPPFTPLPTYYSMPPDHKCSGTVPMLEISGGRGGVSFSLFYLGTVIGTLSVQIQPLSVKFRD